MPDTLRLTSRQRRILEVIREFMAEYGYPPTIRQIGEAVAITSTSVVSYNLGVLQRKGYLARDPDVSRGLRLVEDDLSLVEADTDAEVAAAHTFTVPMLGVIAAGEPIPFPESDASPADYEQIALSMDLVRDMEGLYALRVRGTSMIDALINDGDVVIMRHQRSAVNGDMVAAWLREEKATTLKRIYWEPEYPRVRLQPANPLMTPIYVAPDNVEVQGKVAAVIRTLD